jgi:hypothetical protein
MDIFNGEWRADLAQHHLLRVKLGLRCDFATSVVRQQYLSATHQSKYQVLR